MLRLLNSLNFVRLLIFISGFKPCLTHIDKDKETEETLILEHGLYLDNNITEFLDLCKDLREPAKEDVRIININNITTCHHIEGHYANGKPKLTDRYNIVELYFLKTAQEKIRDQQIYVQSFWRGIVLWILFLIALSMASYLVLAGHFDYKTLPFIGDLFQRDSTDGLEYQQYTWMRYLVLSGDNAVFKGKDPDVNDGAWLQHLRKDHKLDWKGVKTYTRFKFIDRQQESRHNEYDVHSRRKNFAKGWDLTALDPNNPSPNNQSVDTHFSESANSEYTKTSD